LRPRKISKIVGLETKLGQPVSKSEAEALRAKVNELESKLAQSISIAEAEAKVKMARSRLRGKIKKLEELAQSLPKGQVAGYNPRA